MASKILKYTAVLIGVYIGVAYATNAGTLIKAVGGTYTSSVKTLQGRG
jgi:hypothetical protein